MIKLENIIEVIEGLTGITTDTIYDLFFAEKRVIAAIVLHHSDLTEMYKKQNSLSFLFGGGFESRKVKMQSTKLIDERRLVFKHKTLNEISTMHKANIEIDYENIISATIKKGLLTTSLEFEVQKHPKKKTKFSLKRSQIAEVKRVISKILPTKS
jgi:glutamate-1-semialdehyde aminotransferase